MRDAQLIQQGYRFVIAPSAEQEAFLSGCCGASRFWFNQGLELVKERIDRRMAGEAVSVPSSYMRLCSEFAPLKEKVCPWRSQVVIGSMQAGLEQLGRALQNYSRAKATSGNVGFPRFRAKGRCHESVIFQRPRLPDARHVLLDRRLGPIRTRESMRKLVRLLDRDEHARILRSTVQRTSLGWVISFTVERSRKMRRARRYGTAVGVDLGLSRLATLSTGQVAQNARPLRTAFRSLRRLQRRLDRQRRAANPRNYRADGMVKAGRRTWVTSARMRETEKRVLRLHARVANVRREQAHQLTTMLAREFAVIGVETLSVRNLLRHPGLASHIVDVGWAMILAQLAYKTSWSDGSVLIAADRFYPSSKTCSACGAVRAKLSLSERVFSCNACGYVQDRDVNAALNLARVAARSVQADGLPCLVADTEAETLNARGGQVSLEFIELSPVKREESSDSSRDGNAPALVA